MAKAISWTFEIRNLRTEHVATIEISVTNTASLISSLNRLKAPGAVIGFVRHQGANMPRVISWRTNTHHVRGKRS